MINGNCGKDADEDYDKNTTYGCYNTWSDDEEKNKMQHVADAIHALVAEPCLISNLGSTCHDNDHHSDGGDQFKFNDIYLGMVHCKVLQSWIKYKRQKLTMQGRCSCFLVVMTIKMTMMTMMVAMKMAMMTMMTMMVAMADEDDDDDDDGGDEDDDDDTSADT